MSVRVAERRTRVTGRAAGLLIAVTVALLFAISPVRAYMEQRRELQDLQRQAATLEHANAQLSARIALLHQPSYLERLARECLGMVQPGETSFIAVPKDGAPSSGDC